MRPPLYSAPALPERLGLQSRLGRCRCDGSGMRREGPPRRVYNPAVVRRAFELFDRPFAKIGFARLVHRLTLVRPPKPIFRLEVGIVLLAMWFDKERAQNRRFWLWDGCGPARIPGEEGVRAFLLPIQIVIVNPHVVVLALQEVFAVTI